MMPIPDDHLPAKDLQRQFVELGRQEKALQGGRQRRQRRTPALAIVVLGLLATTAGATKVFVIDSGLITGSSDEQPKDVLRAPMDRRLSQIRVQDPDGGPPWGARTYVGSTGQSCVVIGRVKAGRLGLLDKSGFAPYATNVPGTCVSPREMLVASRTYRGRAEPRTVIFGVVGRDVRHVELQTQGGSHAVTIANDGVFLEVLRGARVPVGSRLKISTDAGVVTRRLR